jgi:hypothetical protein
LNDGRDGGGKDFLASGEGFFDTPSLATMSGSSGRSRDDEGKYRGVACVKIYDRERQREGVCMKGEHASRVPADRKLPFVLIVLERKHLTAELLEHHCRSPSLEISEGR